MSKIALMFPGQGAQTVGMGKDLYDKYSKAREIIDLSGDMLKKIIFEGPEETLKLTKYTQPAIFTVSMAAFAVFKELFDSSDVEFVAAGHSLGEYSALCAAGFFGFEDGLSMVKARGEFIQKSSEENPGLMAAILGMEKSVVEDICKQASNLGVCEAINFNSPGQIVIAGTTSAVNKAVELAAVAEATKTIILNASGPFHSSLMIPASSNMAKELEKYKFSIPTFGVYTNCDASLTTAVSVVKEKLVKQIKSSVKWDESIQNIIASGFNKFIEIGPGRVLSGLLRRIDRTKRAFNIEDSMSLQKTLEELNK
ncbi:MAG: ACP S-malonyltransferase [Endomicrobium sp.]|uniref:ACP S-malonyltransferase n=1 Tax=Candidatus Endomicrobiellum pyrsonymphae TaxID=1408203 RepID=UPI003574951A|nr:ACP S-malonyltransferase [Endomicrobium sp.]